jgi:hypothetical protein
VSIPPTSGLADIFQPAPPPPNHARVLNTTINKQKHEATFSFTASGTVAGFDCALIRPTTKGTRAPGAAVKFSACRSPKTYTQLKAGSYTFEVKAFNAGGFSNTAVKHFSI